MHLTSRQLFPLIQRARQEAGLPPFKNFNSAQTILARHNCNRQHIDPYHTLYDAAHALYLLTRPQKRRVPLNTYTPPTTDAQIAHLLHTTPHPKQTYTLTPAKLDQLKHLHAGNRLTPQQREARLQQLALKRQKRAKLKEERALAREKRKQQALANLQKIAERKAARLANKSINRERDSDRKRTLLAQGYIPLTEAFEIFNAIRAHRGLPPYSAPRALILHLANHSCPRLKRNKHSYYYHTQSVRNIAQNSLPRGRSPYTHNLRPKASQAELDSGEYTTLKEFSTLTGISYHNIYAHERRYNFHSLTHPVTGYTLIHTPTAAAHFLKHYSHPITT